uniref:PCI domain-containing protein n=1 Tax=Pseudo-nitzschia australis TaxID=44445 RepID=A0A7S4AEF6_9STRA|mmetsp:Transcript_8600/g.18562  ORF Transcript_8600/g.18562 Transcript_8600/m.18562 type:complete len:419 (+) Transcript_8600:132-1388(+)|eukprot:CAMPEP_0168175878 /NCGR_PEP_ID=MMETSP0139_2-20121125/7421_1 /TAXON_ID=44445 /ORGANISM="Pseudo-nitzschia australis, Strain 10249 10 AB" /LENGTH=418 /DNA_ID=CAMNT_0008094423 /DNA_START=176 /DNA_END=1432 /DNA_ORIENTATION=+
MTSQGEKGDAKAAPKPPSKPKLGQPSASEESASKYPSMELCQQIHKLVVKADESGDGKLQSEVLTRIREELENPTLYESIESTLGVTTGIWSAVDIASQKKANQNTAEELEQKVQDAKESAGDMEVQDARVELARFAAKSLKEEEALEAYQKLLDLPKISSGKKIDAVMESSRVASFYGDSKKASEFTDSAQKMATEGGGGDWDRRNRLKVYRGLQRLLERDIKGAAALLIDCIATFSCNEICSYQDFIIYSIMSNLLHLPRPQIKAKILDGPEILSVANDIPVVIKLVQSLYDCDYKSFLNAMVEVEPILQGDRYFQPHLSFWMRELHILAYKQFLDSYQSVTLQAMADAFGVSIDFVDYHASRFIAAGRLSAKIDKYGGVILTNRPDLKNAQYRETIQKGDLLLNRIQKLARVVDL